MYLFILSYAETSLFFHFFVKFILRNNELIILSLIPSINIEVIGVITG